MREDQTNNDRESNEQKSYDEMREEAMASYASILYDREVKGIDNRHPLPPGLTGSEEGAGHNAPSGSKGFSKDKMARTAKVLRELPGNVFMTRDLDREMENIQAADVELVGEWAARSGLAEMAELGKANKFVINYLNCRMPALRKELLDACPKGMPKLLAMFTTSIMCDNAVHSQMITNKLGLLDSQPGLTEADRMNLRERLLKAKNHLDESVLASVSAMNTLTRLPVIQLVEMKTGKNAEHSDDAEATG